MCYKWFDPFTYITHALAKIKGKIQRIRLLSIKIKIEKSPKFTCLKMSRTENK